MTDLGILMARDPLDLTRNDINTIVEAMRKARGAFNLGNLKAGSTKPLSEKQQKIKTLGDSLDIKL